MFDGSTTLWRTVVSGLVFFYACQADAWIKICNRTSANADVAFAWVDVNDNRDPSFDNGWIVKGWWSLQPGQCASVYPHELWRRNRYYYYDATSPFGKWAGGEGSSSFCITSARMQIPQSSRVKSECGGTISWTYRPPMPPCGGAP